MNNSIVILMIILLIIATKIKFCEHEKKFVEYDKKINKACNSMENFVVNLDDKNDSTAITNFLSIAKGEKVTVKSLVITGDMKIGGSLSVDGDSTTNGNNTIGKNNTIGGDITIIGNNLTKGNGIMNGPLTVNGLLTVKNGSRFSGDRHYFNDNENGKVRLRVGCVGGKPGICAEDNQELMLENSANGGGLISISGKNVICGDMYSNNVSVKEKLKGTLIIENDLIINGNFFTKGSLNVGGTATINDLFTVKNGSRFSGGRHLFNDQERNDVWLRVGCSNGKPGLCAENGQELALETSSNGGGTFSLSGKNVNCSILNCSGVGCDNLSVRTKVNGTLNVENDLNVGKSSIINGSINIGDSATINGKVTVNDLFTVKNGSRFSGGRHLFNDEERKDAWLRVGCARGKPGLCAENGQELVLETSSNGSGALSLSGNNATCGILNCNNISVSDKVNGRLIIENNLIVNGSLNVGGTATINDLFTVKNGSQFSGGRHLFNDAERNDCWLRVGCVYGRPGISAIGGNPFWLENSAEGGGVTIFTGSTIHIKDGPKFVKYQTPISIHNSAHGQYLTKGNDKADFWSGWDAGRMTHTIQ